MVERYENIINFEHVAYVYYSKMIDYVDKLIIEDKKDDISYPLDILHDVTFILQEKPKIVFFFCKNYISTYALEIQENRLVSFDDNERNKSYLNLIDYYLNELSSYRYVNVLFFGDFHEYDLKYEHNLNSVKTLLEFYKYMFVRKMNVYFVEDKSKQENGE